MSLAIRILLMCNPNVSAGPERSADADRDRASDTERDAACDGWDSGDCTGTHACPPRCPRFVDKRGDAWTLRGPRDGDVDRLAETYDAFGSADRAQGIPPVVEHRRIAWIEMLLEEGYNVVAEGHDGRLVGHAVYTPVDDDAPELAVFVHPAYQGCGIGTELCRQVIAGAVEAGCEMLELHVEAGNRVAIDVYRRLGFEVAERNVELRMTLSLDDEIAGDVGTPPAARNA